jgi:hypothetical protein
MMAAPDIAVEYRLIPLQGGRGDGQSAKVSPEDYDQLKEFQWHYHDGYVARGGRKGLGEPASVRMHRQVMNAPQGAEVDHVNHDRLDNRRENLRLCTRSENAMNSLGVGVALRKGAWDASIDLGNKRHHLGRYPTKEEALKARDAARLYHYGEFANVEYPDVTPRSITDIAASAPSQKTKAKSGFFGVHIARRGKKHYWAARVGNKHLGYYPTAIEAARAFDQASYEAYGVTARLNFPDAFPDVVKPELLPAKVGPLEGFVSEPVDMCEFCEAVPAVIDGLCKSCIVEGVAKLEIERDYYADVVKAELIWAQNVAKWL